MLTVKNTRVVSFSRDHLDVYWEIPPINEDIQEYEFYVLRSEAEGGPYQTIAGPLIDRYFLRDSSVLQISATRCYFYRVKVRHVPSGREFTTPQFDRWGEEDLIAWEIIRREAMLWREHAGTPFWVFPRRTFGQRCPQCYDPVLGKRNQDSCPTCFNTTFSGGYHYPVKTWGQIDEPEDAEQSTIEDHRQVKYYMMRTSPSPDIKPLDLVVDHLNRRHRVVSRGGTTKHGVAVRQEFRTVVVQRGSIEDKIPLRVDEQNEVFAPPRNFTNPHNLEVAKTDGLDMDSIFNPYKY